VNAVVAEAEVEGECGPEGGAATTGGGGFLMGFEVWIGPATSGVAAKVRSSKADFMVGRNRSLRGSR